MKIKKVTAVYFSPTGGTKACAEAIASELASDYGTVNLTFPYERKQVHEFGPEDLVIIGAPVYAGRIPAVDGGLFSTLHGNDTPAVFLVSYGNRAYDDALLEEKDLCEARGFRGIGASAWIAPHTFSSRIGAGRPDAEDREKIHAFAQRIQVLAEGGVPAGAVLALPGNRPYREVPAMPFHPEAPRGCIRCRRCVSACPVQAISPAAPEKTDASKCLDCLACVRVCPVHVRSVYRPALSEISAGCEENFLSPCREPECFYPEVPKSPS